MLSDAKLQVVFSFMLRDVDHRVELVHQAVLDRFHVLLRLFHERLCTWDRLFSLWVFGRLN